jgi:hypothetical protein
VRLESNQGLVALLLCVLASGCGNETKAPADGRWQVSIQGYGPIRSGMTIPEATAAAGRQFTSPSPGMEECDYIHFLDDTTRAVLFMVSNGRIARVDINDSTISTNHGVRIGDPETRVYEAYPNRVTSEPHKYVEGHYLTVAPEAAADSGLAIVFETDGSRVTGYRSGRTPEVEYVEGCS